jgi:hypothetical protein
MPVASAISLCPDIRGLRSIGVQRKLPWQRTSDDEHSVCHSRAYCLPSEWTGTPPQHSGQGSFNAEAAHRLSVE